MPAASKDFSAPDETRPAGSGTVHGVTLGDAPVGRATFPPGWKWSNDLKPIMGTDSCQMDHLGYAVSGTLHVVAEDGDEIDIKAGEVYRIGPGHDAWVVGDEDYVGIEFNAQTVTSFAKTAE